jgi:hypothetical protein
MNALAKIKNAGFEVWLKDNGNIGIKPFDALTPQQLDFLKTHKAEIIKELSANNPKPTSEATHNAQGRFFKFLATWPDGRQCYLCQMPRQTVDEMRAQFPDVTHIEPITGEHYDD